MSKNEKNGSRVASIAAKGLQKPSSLTKSEIRTIAGSVLTQAPDLKGNKK